MVVASVTMAGCWSSGVMKVLSDSSMWRGNLYSECLRVTRGE